MIQFDEHIFQMGWFNHLVLFFVKCKDKRRIGWFGEGDKDDLVKMGLLSLVVGLSSQKKGHDSIVKFLNIGMEGCRILKQRLPAKMKI